MISCPSSVFPTQLSLPDTVIIVGSDKLKVWTMRGMLQHAIGALFWYSIIQFVCLKLCISLCRAMKFCFRTGVKRRQDYYLVLWENLEASEQYNEEQHDAQHSRRNTQTKKWKLVEHPIAATLPLFVVDASQEQLFVRWIRLWTKERVWWWERGDLQQLTTYFTLFKSSWLCIPFCEWIKMLHDWIGLMACFEVSFTVGTIRNQTCARPQHFAIFLWCWRERG